VPTIAHIQRFSYVKSGDTVSWAASDPVRLHDPINTGSQEPCVFNKYKELALADGSKSIVHPESPLTQIHVPILYITCGGTREEVAVGAEASIKS